MEKPTVIAVSASGAGTARRLAEGLGAPMHGRAGRVGGADAEFDNALEHIRSLFAARVPVIGVCAAGILIRAVAPLLQDKRSEPPVLAVAEDGSAVVPLLGGHYGANRLARQLSGILGARAEITTAGDLALGLALDDPPPGWRLGTPDRAKSVMAAILGGARVGIGGDELSQADWFSRIPDAVLTGDGFDPEAGVTLVASMASFDPPDGRPHLVYRPTRVTLGVGCARNCPPDELAGLVQGLLEEAQLSPDAILSVNTIDLKADEPAILALAAAYGLPLRLFRAAELEAEAHRLQTPSQIVFAEVGCHGVAEGAALAAGGETAGLWYPKRKSAHATCALALAPQPLTELRGRPRGRVSLIGIGPGQAAWRTPEASRLVAEADELVGYGLYIDLLGPLAAGKPRHDFPLGGEEARCRFALERAGEGRDVAIICSGDAGIYAMGALVFELMDTGAAGGPVSDAARRVEVISAPGVSALQAAAARAGAPLGHDFCAISLSDLLTPRADILRRIRAAAEGDFVIAFYNPVSKRRRTLLAEARDILLGHRPEDCPVLLASSLGRPEEEIRYRTLATLEVDEVDMLTTVLIGSSQSRLAQLGEGPRMYTPRGYERKVLDE